MDTEGCRYHAGVRRKNADRDGAEKNSNVGPLVFHIDMSILLMLDFKNTYS